MKLNKRTLICIIGWITSLPALLSSLLVVFVGIIEIATITDEKSLNWSVLHGKHPSEFSKFLAVVTPFIIVSWISLGIMSNAYIKNKKGIKNLWVLGGTISGTMSYFVCGFLTYGLAFIIALPAVLFAWLIVNDSLKRDNLSLESDAPRQST